jgi:hypothetical protein
MFEIHNFGIGLVLNLRKMVKSNVFQLRNFPLNENYWINDLTRCNKLSHYRYFKKGNNLIHELKESHSRCVLSKRNVSRKLYRYRLMHGQISSSFTITTDKN